MKRTGAALVVRVLLASLMLGALLCAGPGETTLRVAVAQSPPPGVKEDMGIYPQPATPPTLPAPGGKYTDPVFGTEILRATGPDDCPEPGCGNYYSHWPTFNANNTRLLIRRGQTGVAILKDFNAVNFTVGSGKTVLPDAIQNANCTNCPAGTYMGPVWESATWSNIHQDVIYTYPGSFDAGLKLYSYNVATQQFTLVADLSAASGGTNARFKQMYMSGNDDVFCWLQQREGGGEDAWGFTVYRKSTDQILFNEPDVYVGEINEVHVDKSGKWLHVVIPDPQPDGTGTRFLNLQTGQYQPMVRSVDHTPGHGDLGTEIMVGVDADDDEPGMTARNLSDVHTFQDIIRFKTPQGDNDWTKDLHGTLLADNEGWITIGTYLDWDQMVGGYTNYHVMENEIAQIATDGSRRVRRLAHTYTVVAADDQPGRDLSGITPKPSNNYNAIPKPTITKDGKYIAFNSNWGNSDRTDLFILKVPPVSGATTPAAPTSAAFDDYDLIWTDNSTDEASFRIEWRTLSGTDWTPYLGTAANVTRYAIPPADAQSHYFRVRAVGTGGAVSAPTNEVTRPAQSAGSSLSLNGTSAHVLVNNSQSLSVAGSITVEAWFKVDSIGAYQTIVAKESYGTNTGGGYELQVTNTGKMRAVFYRDNNTFTVTLGTTTVTPGVWHHVAGTFDSGTNQRRLFLDGALETTASSGGPTSGQGDLKIGRRNNGTHSFGGLVDEVRVSNAALYAADFKPEANLTASGSTVGLWKFDGGQTVDSSSYANNGSLQGGAAYSSDVPVTSHYSLLLNGGGDYVLVNNSPDLAISGSITVEAWFKVNSTSSYQTIVAKESYGVGQSGGGYELQITNTGKVRAVFYQAHNAFTVTLGTTTVTPGVWHHVAGTFDGTNRRLFLDGVLEATASGGGPAGGDNTLKIGRRNNGTYPLNGLVDEVRVSNTALYSGNFTRRANLPADASTVGLWKFSQTPGDSSGKGNNGTLQGGAGYSTDVP